MLEAVLKGVEPDPVKRSCYDCRSCKAAVSWWCTNEQAVEARGTKIPGVTNCPFWTAARRWEDLSRRERWFGDFVFITPKEQPEDTASP